jgi:membrane-associated phospholipid phosphatase
MFAKRVDTPSAWPKVFGFVGAVHRAEGILLAMLCALLLACFVAAGWRHQAVEWSSFAPAIAICFALIGIGLYLRVVKQTPRLGVGVVGFGIFMAFTGTVSILAYTMFPFIHKRVDLQLIDLDAKLGFVWLDFVEKIASVPNLGWVLRLVYQTSLFQMLFVIVLLAFLNRPTDMHRFLLTAIIAMMVTLLIWWRWPSVGPPGYVNIPQDLASQSSLMADHAVGLMLVGWANEGVSIITPDIVTGTVSFPSYHLIMALLVVWFTWRTIFFAPILVLNTTMIPATILHGGHHLIDLAGGIMTFGLCLWFTCWLVPRPRPEPAG